MQELETIYLALRSLEKLTGLHYEILETQVSGRNTADAIIEIYSGKDKSRFEVEVKNLISQITPNSVANQMKVNGANLFVSKYIPKPIKESLRDRGINYLEVSGNCFIKSDKIFLFINDQKVSETRISKEGKLWNASGLKFIFAILRFPGLINSTQRDIAAMSNIALGTVGLLLNELERETFLKINGEGHNKYIFIENRDRLEKKWAEHYSATLKPKLMKGKFRFMRRDDEHSWMDLPVEGFYWGGENAGALLTNFLRPENFTIYTKLDTLSVMKQLKLVPDRKGNIEVLEQFWEGENNTLDIKNTVPPLLAYAELMSSFDSRCRETAERIKHDCLR